MFQPDGLKSSEPLQWSPGTGTEVWTMLSACAAGDRATVQRLVAANPSLVRCHYVYRTPIYFAVRENRLDLAAFLLDRGADPFGLVASDSLLETARYRGYAEMEGLLESRYAALHGASPAGDVVAAAIRERNAGEVRRLLADRPELARAGDRRSNQPIHWAAMTRQVDLIDEVLAHGADIDARRQDGARPIQLANGDYHYRGWRDVPKTVVTTPGEVVAHLLARGAEYDICTASSLGDVERVRSLLDRDPTLANRASDYVTYYAGSGTPLRNAAARGHLAVVALLLQRGADPNLREEGIAPNGHALYSAVSNGHLEIAKLLLEHGADANAQIESSGDALSMAIGKSNAPMVELLCSYGASRPVELLAYDGDVRTAAAVFAARPAAADDPVALANAAANGHDAFVRLMLRYQPDLPARIAVDRRWTIGAGTRELTELLFAHGMNPRARDWLAITPLHHFAMRGEVGNAALFIDRGADLDARDEDLSSTPLGWAAKGGRAEMVEFLLSRGAKPRLPDDPPWATPLAWAIRGGHQDLATTLQRHATDQT